ncbi:MAG: hypothetical protein KAX49_17965 [Halanaerobiales bacterium]|nr:hypothetical protein [Halanaerobiales bacterium]
MNIAIYRVKKTKVLTFIILMFIFVMLSYIMRNESSLTMVINFLLVLFSLICFVGSIFYYVRTDDVGIVIGLKYFMLKKSIKWDEVKSLKYIEYGSLKSLKLSSNKTNFLVNLGLVEDEIKLIETIEEKAINLKDIDRVKFRYIKKEL